MIAIINQGATSPQEEQDSCGERVYAVKINHNLIVVFTHHRRDGLAVCLEKAAAAVRDVEQNQIEAEADRFLNTKFKTKKLKFESVEDSDGFI